MSFRESFTLPEISAVAVKLLRAFEASRVFAFHGELGAGKTTFIKAICEALGVRDAMSSPSFSIVNEYYDANGTPVYHFDLYRLKSSEEALDLGMEEYLYSGNYCFVEWPERAEEILPQETVHIFIDVQNGNRIVKVE
jgi:tRNA threonylcarbamoyladenosine biosynthesis protein TsaE